MPETSPAEDEIQIKILSKADSTYGSKVEQKRKPLKPGIKTVTVENWSEFFPDKPLKSDKKKEIEEGLLYLKVAIDPKNGKKAGSVEVRRNQNNTLCVDVSKDYQRRGVASSLIKQAQSDHDSLHLLNFAGKAGEKLYLKLGFKPQGVEDEEHFVWEKVIK